MAAMPAAVHTCTRMTTCWLGLVRCCTNGYLSQQVAGVSHKANMTCTGVNACCAHLHQDDHLLAGAGALLHKRLLLPTSGWCVTQNKHDENWCEHQCCAYLHQDDHLLAGAGAI
jgi:hypothetical protein